MVYSYDAVKVVGLVTAAALVLETLLWLLQYRTTTFKSLKSQIDRQSKQLEDLRLKQVGTNKEKMKKKEERLESQMRKDTMKALGPMRITAGVLTMGFLWMLWYFTNTWFGGLPVARLPFQPFSYLAKVSHRNLPGNDLYDCSVSFIYVLCQMGVRPVLSKLLGWGPTRAMNAMGTYKPADAEKLKLT